MGLLDAILDERRRAQILQALGSGLVSGATANWIDELSGDGAQMRSEQDAAPVSYALGETLGSIGPGAALGAGIARHIAQNAGGARQRFLTAAVAGALHGALAGSGGFRPGEISGDERARDAGIGAGIGGVIGGLGVPASRAVSDLADNLPALLGRETLAEGGVVQRALGQGTRRSAPLGVQFAGEGDAQTRALTAFQSALQQDEAAALQRGGAAQFGRFANEGRNLRAFGSDDLGQSMAALRSLAAQSPAGQQRLEGMASDLIERGLRGQLQRMRAPSARAPRGGLLGAATRRSTLDRKDAADLLATMRSAPHHEAWLGEVGRMTQAQRARLAALAVRQLRTEARGASGEAAENFSRTLRDPIVRDKLQALGVRTQALRGSRNNMSGDSVIDAEVERLRRMATRPEDASYNFGNYEDRDLAARGRLSDEDALALLDVLSQPQRAYAVTPSREARILQGRYEQGAQFNPRAWFDGANVDDVMGSVIYAQPLAAGIPSLFMGHR